MKTIVVVRSCALMLLLGLGAARLAQAHTGNLPLQASEPASGQSSYASRVINRKGVREIDPNVYVYGPEFAKRFQMPKEWVSDELKGVDAVAFRVVPGYKSCGWGGNPQACRDDEVRCEMDLYFDHQRNPLPWDERVRPSDQNYSRNSAWFLASFANRFARPRTTLLGGIPLPREPFTDPKTGRELGWQYLTSIVGPSGHGWVAVAAYDRELFQSTSLVTLGVGCTAPNAALVMTSEGTNTPFNPRDTRIFKSILLPKAWQLRVSDVLQEGEGRSNAFFKEQGEKALRALKEAPVPSRPIVPLN